ARNRARNSKAASRTSRSKSDQSNRNKALVGQSDHRGGFGAGLPFARCGAAGLQLRGSFLLRSFLIGGFLGQTQLTQIGGLGRAGGPLLPAFLLQQVVALLGFLEIVLSAVLRGILLGIDHRDSLVERMRARFSCYGQRASQD